MAFLFWHLLSFQIRTCFIYQAELVLIYMELYWPTFSLMFLIHLFLYVGVYSSTPYSLLSFISTDNVL